MTFTVQVSDAIRQLYIGELYRLRVNQWSDGPLVSPIVLLGFICLLPTTLPLGKWSCFIPVANNLILILSALILSLERVISRLSKGGKDGSGPWLLYPFSG